METAMIHQRRQEKNYKDAIPETLTRCPPPAGTVHSKRKGALSPSIADEQADRAKKVKEDI